MSMGGDYNEFHHNYEDKHTQYQLVAATGGPVENIVAAKSANHTLYIQRITVAVTTYSAKTLTFQDDAGTPVPVGHISIPAAAPTGGGNQQYVIDYGPHGVALTAGKNLDIVLSGAGVAAMVLVDAYQKLTGTVSTESGSSNQ